MTARIDAEAPRRLNPGRIGFGLILALGGVVFLFPFYYMLVGALRRSKSADLTSLLPDPGQLTFHNFAELAHNIPVGKGLLNSGIFTGGVILATLVFGVPAGYALARLNFPGRGFITAVMLAVLVIPFQSLLIPLYILVVRNYGLSDSYLGMIIPFAINSTAVLIFRQFFAALPHELFDAARIDGAGELRIMLKIAMPLAKPAILTGALLTFIGPWNDFLWPFLVTKDASKQPFAVAFANYTSTNTAVSDNPLGVILAGSLVLALPAVILFIIFERQFVNLNLGDSIKG